MAILSTHARTRMQQRGIRPEALDALLAYGRTAPAGSGCRLVYFDKAAKARLARDEAPIVRQADSLVRTYAIVGADGLVVTVGHRHRRIPRS